MKEKKIIHYSTPQIEVEEVCVEAGFAETMGGSASLPGMTDGIEI